MCIYDNININYKTYKGTSFMDLKKILNVVKKVLIHTVGLGCVAAVVFAAMFFIEYRFVAPATAKSDRYYINDIYDQPVVQLKHETAFEQAFEAHGDIYGVQIRWHNLAQVQNGTALLELVEADTQTVLASTVYDLQLIVNDVYNEIAFDAPYHNDEEGYQPYILRITPAFDNPEESYLKIWGDINTGSIAFGILEYIVNAQSLYGWFGLLRRVALIAAAAVYAACFIFKFKKENMFIVCLLAVSMLFTLVLPPFSSPDEEGHYNSAYMMVNRWDGYEGEDFDKRTLYKRAEDKNKVFEEKNTTVLNYEFIYENLGKKSSDNSTRAIEKSWLVTDFGGVYFMGAVGIKLAHIFDLGYVQMMYLGRFMNLMFFAACVYMAIKITPVGKNVFMALSFLPITLHIANSFSRDVFVISLGFLFTAYILYLMKQETTYKWWQLLLLAVICMLLAPGKFIYAAMCIAVFALDIKKVPLLNKINWRIHPVVICAAAAVVLVPVMFKIMLGRNPDFRWKIFAMAPLEVLMSVEPDHTISLQHLADNPVYAFRLLADTLFTNGSYYIKSLAGGVLSYNSIEISDAFITIALIMVVISTFHSDDDSLVLSPAQRITFGGIFGIVLAEILFMCLSWTFVRMTTLYGLQGKYLLPVLPMLLIAVKGKRITVKKDISGIICFIMMFNNIFVALNAFVVILQR